MSSKTHNCKCLICGEIKKTQNSMLYHLRSAHNKKMKIGKTWKWTKKKASAKTVKNEKKKAKKKVVKKVIASESKYIDIQMVLRVPITVGQVQILAIE